MRQSDHYNLIKARALFIFQLYIRVGRTTCAFFCFRKMQHRMETTTNEDVNRPEKCRTWCIDDDNVFDNRMKRFEKSVSLNINWNDRFVVIVLVLSNCDFDRMRRRSLRAVCVLHSSHIAIRPLKLNEMSLLCAQIERIVKPAAAVARSSNTHRLASLHKNTQLANEQHRRSYSFSMSFCFSNFEYDLNKLTKQNQWVCIGWMSRSRREGICLRYHFFVFDAFNLNSPAKQ